MRRALTVTVLAVCSLVTAACGYVLGIPNSTNIGRDPGAAGDGDAGGAAGDGATAADSNTPSGDASPCAADVSGDDALNCGVCGRKCGGDVKCRAGLCEAVSVADTTNPLAMTTDQNFVYWLDSGGLWRVAKSGGTKELVTVPPSKTAAIAADGEKVFWSYHGGQSSEPGKVFACPATGCADAAPTTIFTRYSTDAIDVANGHVYVGGRSDSNVYGVWRVPTDGGFDELLRDAGATLIAVRNDLLARASADVKKGAPTPGAPEDYVGSFVGTLTGLATDGTTVAWSDLYEDGGGSVQWSGAGFVNGAAPSAVAVDDRYVYWTSMWINDGLVLSGSVVACPLAGCPASGPIVVASHLDKAFALAIDATNLYVATGGEFAVNSNGAILRVPKL